MILVTGGTGLVGSHLLYELALKNDVVRAIYRSDASIKKTKLIFGYYKNGDQLFNHIEWVKASINDVPSLIEAFKNVSYVYHCAALVSFDSSDFELLQKTNVEGTANIVNLCLSEQVTKLCYVSSIATIGESISEAFITEKNDWNNQTKNSVYSITKYSAELEVWRGTQEGLNAVIVNPGVIIGPGIWDSGSGVLFHKLYKGLSYTSQGVTGYVGVKDVVNVMERLMTSEICEQRFILVSENLSYNECFKFIANALKVKPPKKEVSKLQLSMVWRLDALVSFITGKHRALTKSLAHTFLNKSYYSSQLVMDALSFQFRPIKQDINETATYFLEAKKH